MRAGTINIASIEVASIMELPNFIFQKKVMYWGTPGNHVEVKKSYFCAENHSKVAKFKVKLYVSAYQTLVRTVVRLYAQHVGEKK